jgi:glyoxylase-like metal-dependent hydrolase (beta-lactamase superfamily II)
VFGAELEAARAQQTALDRARYRPMQWDDNIDWQRYAPEGERWFGFSCVRELVGVPPEILMVPLAGHTLGHCGVAVRGPQGWLLHAGDAYFFRGEMDLVEQHCTPMLRAYQRFMAVDNRARLVNQTRLRELKRTYGSEIRLFCAHDAEELECLAPIATATAPITGSPLPQNAQQMGLVPGASSRSGGQQQSRQPGSDCQAGNDQ